jgi:hypothetical protein
MFRRRVLVVALLGVLVVVGAGAVWFARPRKLPVTVDVSGTRGLAIKGTAEVDGRPQELTGAVPAKFVLEGSRVSFLLSTTEDSGEMRVRGAIGDVAFGSNSSGNPPRRGVRGWVQSGWGWSPPTYWIESYDTDGDQKWMTPPPWTGRR